MFFSKNLKNSFNSIPTIKIIFLDKKYTFLILFLSKIVLINLKNLKIVFLRKINNVNICRNKMVVHTQFSKFLWLEIWFLLLGLNLKHFYQFLKKTWKKMIQLESTWIKMIQHDSSSFNLQAEKKSWMFMKVSEGFWRFLNELEWVWMNLNEFESSAEFIWRL